MPMCRRTIGCSLLQLRFTNHAVGSLSLVATSRVKIPVSAFSLFFFSRTKEMEYRRL
jgi:hypothetical protein